ncbi:fasciclin domain-containing protein [Maribacter arenosus]|uniref:fasciclin domain-containing protein n=1 Tax=Maribacter arenosus TaxID=1854708 RepID=UPI001CB765F0|nr:fasciclin domain-containing protein [Maribacter arenosus]
MKNVLQLRRFFFLALLSLFVLSCDKDENDGPAKENEEMNIVQTAVGQDALSSLVAALTKADEKDGTDLVQTLSGDGPFTVFAPTNEAFTALLGALDGFDSLEDFDTDEEKDLLATILTYHVVAGVAAKSTDLSNGQSIATVQGEDVSINLEGGVFIQDATETDATVVMADVMASNGVVHVINKVLLPQAIIDALNGEEEEEEELGTLVDIVVEAESLSILEAAVLKADLAGTLSSEGPFTVFAPSDDAFIALLDILGDDYNGLDDFDTEEEMMLLKDILLYHVIPAEVKAADLAEGSVATAFSENSIHVIASGETFVIGDASDVDANITGTDIMASNGVAHTIDKVLLPQAAIDFVTAMSLKTIVEIAVETDDLSLLVGALQQANAGLVETLNGEGPFTVFAPTNAAFVALLDALGDDYHSLADFDTQDEKDLLVKVLTYHVVAGAAAFSTDLSDGQMIETVQGESVGVNIKDGMVHIVDATDSNATVVLADVEASNGVVHVINKVLVPQEVLDMLTASSLKTIVEIAVETDDLSLLVGALQQANAGLVETLSGDGPFTVFAPTNEAFVALLDALGDDYHSLADFDTQEEKDLLVKVLTYHVVAGAAAFSTDLSDGQMIETFQGEKVGISIMGGMVYIDDATAHNAKVVLADVEASNGVVHVINKVLLPQEVLDILNPPVPNIVETAQSVDDLSLLVDALIQADAGLVEALSGEGPFTVFAPTNAAFEDLLALIPNCGSIADFDTEEEKALLAKILTYHVVAGAAVASGDLSDHQEIVTLQGESVFAIIDHGVAIRDKTHTDANVVGADVVTSNGIVHVIDKVLLSQEVLTLLGH